MQTLLLYVGKLQGKTEVDDNVWQLFILYKLLHKAECLCFESWHDFSFENLLAGVEW